MSEEKKKGIEAQLEHIRHSKDVVHKHSPGVGKILDLAVTYVFDAEKAAAGGKNVIWTAGLAECPLFYACGAIPLAFTEMGRLGSTEAISISEDIFQLPRETCSMVKVILGELYLRQKSTARRLFYSSRTCEPYNIAFELVRQQFGFDIHVDDVGVKPDDISPERYEILLKYYKAQLRQAAAWISGGKPLDEEKLGEELKRYNRAIRKARTIMNLRKQHPTYIRSLPAMFILLGSSHYFGKPQEYEEAIDLIIEELSALEPGEYNDTVVPLVWSGARGQEFGVYEAIDEAGGSVLGWCIPNTFERGFDETKTPLDALVEFQIGGKNSGTTSQACLVIENQVKKSDAKGLILYGYVGCSFGSIDIEMKRNHFKKRDIPSIAIDGTFQVGPPTGQLITRVKAFVEMLS
ncbi:2-hydroxyglutaryl-CoA dehydratase [Spirochaetia bacterium]|nr:2-hydroxyglutaryl-CoA dehydratase [Spirochaetia bacterium]GHV78946.1 2-hydroxyglutaryl-CoA dehydratase [Spirochaetia bacterium]